MYKEALALVIMVLAALLILPARADGSPFGRDKDDWGEIENMVGGKTAQIIRSDLDGMGCPELVVLTMIDQKAPLGKIYIFSEEKDKLWESIPIPAWKIWVADVNNDKQNDLIIALNKYEKVDQQLKNRLYVYGWDGEAVFPIWKGTSLGRPYIDLAFADVNNDGKTELVSLEKNQSTKNKTFVTVYHWNGFGFAGIDQIVLKGDYQKIEREKGRITVYNKTGEEYVLF